ncbi:TIGR01459 family HAD-type hydrolase [Alphaproteobacteria bacterium]|nr:TIGR01459 family HAD-type hydrolase [Alphaproteobacteria bacterium]
MPNIQIISGLSDISANYNAIICDVWGVLHNGQAPFRGADEALFAFRQAGGKVLLLSNAPRPAHAVASRLAEIGVRTDAYDDILTSGDAARTLLEQRGALGQKCFHLGPEKDADLVAGVDIEFCDLQDADFILMSGLYDDSVETPDDYAEAMANWMAHGKQLICANPDRLVQVGDQIIYCGGAVAELYENMGGDVVWLGKPYPAVYERAQTMLAKMLNTDIDSVHALAIGDGPKTDIPGAEQAGLDALFITGGLAGAMGRNLDTVEDIAQVLNEENTHAAFAQRHLAW